MAFARAQFALGTTVDASGTEREHRRRLLRREPRSERGRAHKAALLAERADPTKRCPPLFVGLWQSFLDLDRWRGGGGMGMAPLTLHDVEAWERRTGVTLSAEDCDVVKQLDIVRLTAASASRKQQPSTPSPR